MAQDLLSAEVPSELWKDTIWDQLLDALADRAVIPIIGPDLLHVDNAGTTVRLDRLLAERLAAADQLSLDDLPADKPLNYVVCQLLRRGRDRFSICEDLYPIVAGLRVQPSTPLRQLAEITDFNLYLTTTFDSLLEKAINEVRFGGSAGTLSISYSRKRPKERDLPSSKERLGKPTVYYLMGKLSTAGDCVISDEDLLEHVCGLQLEDRRPDRLFDELRKNHLLVLGEDFSDWLARIFLRTAKGGPLSATREYVEILADSNTRRDASLVAFLLHFSRRTRVFRAGGATEFVQELWQRWHERQPVGPAADADVRRALPRNGIFISYASEDLPAVQQLKEGLMAAGLPVWFDDDSLKPGDNFHPQIEQYITRGCCCFVAVISQYTERRHEGYFRREWNLAVERDKGIYYEKKFIVPVVVDDTEEPAKVPLRFRELNYTWLPGGRVTPGFARELRAIVNGA
jgi:hypothetical protein